MNRKSSHGLRTLTTLLVMTGVAAVAGNAVAADRTVVGEYFSADW